MRKGTKGKWMVTQHRDKLHTMANSMCTGGNKLELNLIISIYFVSNMESYT
jgi:hypothetical protein